MNYREALLVFDEPISQDELSSYFEDNELTFFPVNSRVYHVFSLCSPSDLRYLLKSSVGHLGFVFAPIKHESLYINPADE